MDDGNAGSGQAYSYREVLFSLAHWEELVTLNEAGETARDLREALKHELENLPAGIHCLCDAKQPTIEAADGAGGAGRWRTPSVALTDIKRAIASLPVASTYRTRLYLMTTPTHDFQVRHAGQPCDANWYGESSGQAGHLIYHTETQVHAMSDPEFGARHRRRVALNSFGQRSRAQDSYTGETGVEWLVNYLNDGEAFIERRFSRPQEVAA